MIDKIPCGFINSVYNFNDYTLNELICKLAQKMDEVITQSNESFSYLDWLKGEGLSDEVIKTFLEWKENGTLENIINENIFNDLNNKITETTSQLKTNSKGIDKLSKHTEGYVNAGSYKCNKEKEGRV